MSEARTSDERLGGGDVGCERHDVTNCDMCSPKEPMTPATGKCACVAFDAQECIRRRSGFAPFETEDYMADRSERCECLCHREYEEHERDLNDGLEDLVRG